MADGFQVESSRNPLSKSRPPTIVLRPLPSVLGLPTFPLSLPFTPSTPEPLNPLTPSRFLPSRAFSLVELLAVVGIVAILSIAAVPVMRGLGGSQSSRATAQVLLSALEQTRTAAILSGTNAYLALPDQNFPVPGYPLRSYAIIREKATTLGGANDDIFTNSTAAWFLLSKWEKLPGDLIFSSQALSQLTTVTPTGISFPSNATASTLPVIGFTPSGTLVNSAGTNGLLFASSNRVSNGKAAVADRIEVSQYSGRIRYAGVVTNTAF